jgi:gamma-glutamyl hercynylcysteine S-oxide synthase
MVQIVAAEIRDVMEAVRRRTFGLVAHLDEDQLTAVHSPIMSPLAWDLGHVAAYEDLWLNHRVGKRDLLRPGLAELYDAFETPRDVRGDLEFLRGAELREYMAQVRERALEAPVDPDLHELVVRHELQHTETMLQTMRLAGLEPPEFTGPAGVDGSGLEFADVPAGPAEIGAGAEGFAYDNERPRHTADVAAFAIGRTPVANGSWLSFAEGGGYERREWWTDEGWAWKEDYDITHHAGAEAGPADAPVVHVSWFEADAFARAHAARLPTEVEWEKAATWAQITGIGQVWEWTSSPFTGYAGFVAHPYREYSEVFFGDRYRVLRGGSCATHPRVATTTFRNWDLPLRRQLFSGVRLAR